MGAMKELLSAGKKSGAMGISVKIAMNGDFIPNGNKSPKAVENMNIRALRRAGAYQRGIDTAAQRIADNNAYGFR